MRPRIRKQARAERDLIDIWHYTEDRWGEARADRYLDEIDAALDRLCDNPLIGVDCGHIRAGYRRFTAGSHYIFYRLDQAAIEVIRVLHIRMDHQAQLEE